MGRPMKPLQKSDISKNSSQQISHTIKKIKENETKYTVILVLVFMVVFCFVGYFTLRVTTTDSMIQWVKKPEMVSYGISLSSRMVTLTNDNIGVEEKDVATYILDVDNHSFKDISFQIRLVEDYDIISSCGCMDYRVDPSSIHYEIEEETGTFTDDPFIVTEKYLMHGYKKRYFVKLWLDSSLNPEEEVHFHGHFAIEEI